MKHLAALALTVLLAGCAGPKIDSYTGSTPAFPLEQYFAGTTTATGVFIDRFGTLRRHFDVVINGTWDGSVLTLTEDFDYADGEKSQRVWTLRKTGDGQFVGTAPDVIGEAQVQQTGQAATLGYQIDLKVGEDTWRVSFEDWLWRLDDQRVFNRAVVRRWGIEIGQVLIFFERQPPASG